MLLFVCEVETTQNQFRKTIQKLHGGENNTLLFCSFVDHEKRKLKGRPILGSIRTFWILG